MAKRKPTISPTEMEALKVLWEHGPRSYREVHQILADRGNAWATTTVQTLLQRLQSKGFVNSTLRSGTSVFRPAVSRDRFLQQRLKSLSKDICGGVDMPLALNLIKGSNFTPDQIEQLKSLLGEKQTDSKGERPKRRRDRN